MPFYCSTFFLPLMGFGSNIISSKQIFFFFVLFREKLVFGASVSPYFFRVLLLQHQACERMQCNTHCFSTIATSMHKYNAFPTLKVFRIL